MMPDWFVTILAVAGGTALLFIILDSTP